MAIKFCVKCGTKFNATGREVICPDCKAAAAEDAKRAAVERAKMRSYTGEACPVRISGRASTVIRRYGAANNLPFAQALDALLKSTNYFKGVGITWEEVEPYRSRRRDKHATETEGTIKPQNEQEAPQDEPAKPVETAAKKTVKKAAKTAGKATSKKVASKK